MKIKYSVIVPVYKNEGSIARLLKELCFVSTELGSRMEAVFVVDGSPDKCFSLLQAALPTLPFPAQLVAHSRNFGSMAAIRTGLKAAQGQYFAVMAADLQEPPTLVLDCFASLDSDACDVAVGTRNSRKDPLLSRWSSEIFWKIYRRFIVPDMPAGGVDIFACNTQFRDHLLSLDESHSSLIALIFWLGFRRKYICYDRLVRLEGKSAWTLGRKIEYMMDSIFSFTDLPIKLLLYIGLVGIFASLTLSFAVIWQKIQGTMIIPGYATTILTILFMGALNLFAIGLIGIYTWRAYENSKRRPQAVVAVSLNNFQCSDVRQEAHD